MTAQKPTPSPLGTTNRLTSALSHLASTIDSRAGGDPNASWTAKLLAKGPKACADKVHEEGIELADAVIGESDDRVASEAADVLYHALVALRARGVTLDDVAAALEARQGTSGIDEKASRSQ